MIEFVSLEFFYFDSYHRRNLLGDPQKFLCSIYSSKECLEGIRGSDYVKKLLVSLYKLLIFLFLIFLGTGEIKLILIPCYFFPRANSSSYVLSINLLVWWCVFGSFFNLSELKRSDIKCEKNGFDKFYFVFLSKLRFPARHLISGSVFGLFLNLKIISEFLVNLILFSFTIYYVFIKRLAIKIKYSGLKIVH